MKISKEAKTAIIVLIGIASFIFGVSFIKSSSLFNTDKDYYAVGQYKFDDTLQVESFLIAGDGTDDREGYDQEEVGHLSYRHGVSAESHD